MSTVFPTPGTAEQPDLAAFAVRRDQVYDLDARFKDLGGRALVVKGGRFAVDVPSGFRFDLPFVVDGVAQYVQHPAEDALADGHADLRSRIYDFHPAGQPVRRAHRDTADDAAPHMRKHLEDGIRTGNHEFFIDGRHRVLERHVDDRADDLADLSCVCHIVSLLFQSLLPEKNLPDVRSRSSVVIALWRCLL